MLTSIRQVNGEFFRQFHKLTVTVGNETVIINSRYARKSSYDYSEEQENQIYPCIATQDYSPIIKKGWFIDMKQYFGGESFDGLKGFLYRKPTHMEFRYDVSVASKSYNEYIAIIDLFNKLFLNNVGFLFNKKLEGEDSVGDVVPYTIRNTDIPRTDGVYETNYEFTLSPWVYLTDPTEVELVQKIIVGMHMTGIQ